MNIEELKEKIKNIQESRRTRYGNIRHKLEDIIIIGLCTIICGGEYFADNVSTSLLSSISSTAEIISLYCFAASKSTILFPYSLAFCSFNSLMFCLSNINSHSFFNKHFLQQRCCMSENHQLAENCLLKAVVWTPEALHKKADWLA